MWTSPSLAPSCSLYISHLGQGHISFSPWPDRVGEEAACGAIELDLREKVEGEMNGCREEEVGMLLAFGTTTSTVFWGDVRTDRDLVLSKLFSALLRPDCFGRLIFFFFFFTDLLQR